VNDPRRVRRRQRLGDLPEDGGEQGGVVVEAAGPGQAVLEPLALQVLHHDVGVAAGVDVAVQDLDDAGMTDQGSGARLGEEAGHDLIVVG
jgi:hypothetical protein